MSTRLTTGLLCCLMMSFLVGCASSPVGLIRGQSPSAYPMPEGTNSGHGFGTYSQGVPFPFNGFAGKALKSSVQGQANAYYGMSGSPVYANGGYGAAGYPVSGSYPVSSSGGGVYSGVAGGSGATCENGYCNDPNCQSGYCQPSYCIGDCMFGHGHRHGQACCPHCNGRGCPHCHGTGHGHGDGGQWAPTHLYQHMYKIPQGMVYPQNPTPGAITVYPYYTHKAPDDFFYPSLKK